jgi:hypothetical protein
MIQLRIHTKSQVTIRRHRHRRRHHRHRRYLNHQQDQDQEGTRSTIPPVSDTQKVAVETGFLSSSAVSMGSTPYSLKGVSLPTTFTRFVELPISSTRVSTPLLTPTAAR